MISKWKLLKTIKIIFLISFLAIVVIYVFKNRMLNIF